MIRKNMSIPAGRKLFKRIAACLILGLLAAGILSGCKKDASEIDTDELVRASVGWPSAFDVEEIDEPPFEDEPGRTNNAFNVVDFGEQGHGGWFYRYGNSKRPQRSRRMGSVTSTVLPRSLSIRGRLPSCSISSAKTLFF